MKFSDWQDRTTKPTLVGVYETIPEVSLHFWQHWNGEFWGLFCSNKEQANNLKNKKSFAQDPMWRGILEE